MKKIWTLIALISFSTTVHANTDITAAIDTIWLVTAAALVFFMQAGFALLESGMSRSKNAVNVIMKNYTDTCIGALVFWAFGYGIMFGSNPSGLFGQDHFLISDVGAIDYTLLLFQMMFAATAVTIASGAMAERTNYLAYLVGAVGITALIYPIYGSWAWGSQYSGIGWLKQLGFIDFAGSTVVHSIGGWCALAGIIVLGPRLGRFSKDRKTHEIPGHNLTIMALGGFILWLGWFGFNGGSATADVSIGLISLNTHLSAAASVIGIVLIKSILDKPVYASQIINGSIAGLVAITAGCATMQPIFAILTGLVASIFLLIGIQLLENIGLDDVVGAVSAHGICGAWGTLAAGMFMDGNLFNMHQIIVQLIGILTALIWTLPSALIMYWLIDKTIGLRVSTEDERRGLDYTEHYELGYPEFQSHPLHEDK